MDEMVVPFMQENVLPIDYTTCGLDEINEIVYFSAEPHSIISYWYFVF